MMVCSLLRCRNATRFVCLGYVSYQDFENQVRRLQLEGSKKEILSVAKLLDRDGDGFIDFKNFSQAFHATS